MTEIALALLPLTLLLVSLLLGLYPGCDAILRLSERIAARRLRRRRARRAARPHAHRSHAASGGLLIAFGLAQRPPPLAP